MEALILLLAEALWAPVGAVVLLAGVVALLLVTLLLEALARLAGSSSARFIGYVRKMATLAFIFIGGCLLLANTVLFQPITRLTLAHIERRTGTSISFTRASGDLFSGRFVLEEVRAIRQSETKSSFDLTARRVSGDIDLRSLIVRPIAFEVVSVEGVAGTIRQPEKRGDQQQEEVDEKIRARRRFLIRDLRLDHVDIALSKGVNTPVAVVLDSLRSAPLRSHFALFDMMFRSSLNGTLDGRAFAAVTEAGAEGRVTRWQMPGLDAQSISRLMTRPPGAWLREGTLSVAIDERWQNGDDGDIRMAWTIAMRGVRAQAREGAGLRERAVSLPVTAYLNSKDGNHDFSFGLIVRESSFEDIASLNSRVLWDLVLQSMARSMSIRLGLDGVSEEEAQRR